MFGKRRDGAGAGQSVHVAASCSFTSCLLIAGPDPVKAAIPASLDCAQVCWARFRGKYSEAGHGGCSLRTRKICDKLGLCAK